MVATEGSSSSEKNYYEVLGLSKGATSEEIKKVS